MEEHSRLLKFFTTTRQISEMEDTPIIKIQKEYKNPENVESEVPGSQKIREVDGNADCNSEIEIKTADFSLSPVMTVTKKESTLTKGDIKMQKVTVTEDISMETENGGTTITYTSQSSTHSETSERRDENDRRMRKEGHEEKKSKIPIMRLRQVVERVKREREAQKAREKPRRSSIPKLKDPKKVKRESSLQINPRTEDEFEKIYEEIVDNKQKEIDDKILAVSIEDTEKVESKFEELMNSLEDDVNDRQTVTRISKIPALRRKDDEHPPTKIGALVDKVKVKNTVTETKLKDGGFKVTASSIKTKRFSRGSSRDLSKEDETTVTETIDIKDSGEGEVFTKETVKRTPSKPVKTISTSKQISKDGYEVETTESLEYGSNEIVIKETTTRESIKVNAPVKTEKIVRSVSREVKNDDEKVKNNKEVVTVKEIKNDDGTHTITTTTTVTEDSKEIPREEKIIVRGLSKEFNKDIQAIKNTQENNNGISETVTIKEHKDGDNIVTTKTVITETVTSGPVVTETIVRNISREISSESQNEDVNNNKDSKETKNEGKTRENIKTGIPVKTERFTRGISREMGNIKPRVNKNAPKEEVYENSGQKIIRNITTTEIVKETPVTKNQMSRDISKDLNNGDQNIDIVNKEVTTQEVNKGTAQTITKETIVKESIKESTSTEINDNSLTTTKPNDNKDETTIGTMTTEDVQVKEGIKIGIPVFTKVTESFSKGRIESVEMSRTIEWKPADASKTKKYARSFSSKSTQREIKDQTEINDTVKNLKAENSEKPDTSSSQNQLRDPLLESKIKETVKDVAYKITIKKVTEYETSEKETNIEKNTFILNKYDQDIESGTDANALKESISSKDLREVNKDLIVEKEIDNTNVNLKGKDVNIEAVTILKGNVSRLKNKLVTTENESEAKKEIKEELPKKKSILSKIAVFERLEPKDAYPVNKKITTEKKVSKLTTTQTFEEKPKIIEELVKDSKVDSNGNINKVEIETRYNNNEPIIVQEFWKTQEGNKTIEISQTKININTDNHTAQIENINEQAEKARILPAYINTQINSSENVVKPDTNIKLDSNHLEVPAELSPDKPDFENEIGKTKPGKINLNIWKNQVEINKTLVDKKDALKTEGLNEIAKTLPGKVKIEIETVVCKDLRDETTVETPKTLPYLDTEIKITQPEKARPGKIDFTTTTVPIELPKILPDLKSPRFERDEKEFEIGKVKPGKIDLSLWKNQIEENKKYQRTDEFQTTKEHKYTVKTDISVTRTEHEFISSENQAEEVIKVLPGNVEYSTSDIQIEKPKMLPAVIDYNTSFSQVDETTASTIQADVNAMNIQKETIRILPAKIDINTKEPKGETPTILPAKIDYIPSENEKDVVNSSQEKLDTEFNDKKIDAPVILPGKLNLKAWENQVQRNKTLIGTNSFKTEEKEIKIIRTLPGKIDYTTYESRVEEPKQITGKANSNVHENKAEIRTSQKEYNFEANHSSISISAQENKIITNQKIQTKKELKVDVNKVDIPATFDSAESLSDPELVDEPEDESQEIKRPLKSPLIGKIRNKMFFITNKSIRQNSTKNSEEIDNPDYKETQSKATLINAEHKVDNSINEIKTVEEAISSVSKSSKESFEKTVTSIEENYKNRISMQYESNTHTNIVQNRSSEEFITETSESEFNYDTNRVQIGATRSESGLDNKYTNEDMTRAKSLAELDLGDLVEGQVRRMVVRMKSVDFGKREEKKEKINAKEMPKRMSVLEKIALFESKAAATKNETTTLPPPAVKKNTSRIITEEEYLRRIENMKTAKERLGRLEDMLYLPLSNGIEMPVIALGTALLDKRLLPHIIGAAIDLGYRAFDTAYIYGNEKEVGQAIRDKIENGTVRREDLFIMSKLWSTFHRPDLVEEACRNSLNAMGLDYFDLYMIHNPMSFKEGPDPIPKIATVLQFSQYDYLDAWFGMEGLLAKGLVKSIGVSNFNSQQIQRILDKGRVKPVVNQVECHPYLSQQRLHNYCTEKNITLSCFGVLGSKGTPAELKSSVAPVIDDALVQVMASGLNVTPAQLLIRYQIECGHNVVVKSSSAAHLWDNLQALTFTLDKREVDALHALNRNKRIFTYKGMGDTHKNYPF